MPASKLITLAILVGFAVIDGGAVRIRELRVPSISVYGETVTFSCIYELDGPDDILSSVKWYKDQEEFYRYTPSEHGGKLTFPSKGIIIDREASDGESVKLGPLTMESAGEYRCEVSLDAPTFVLVSSKRNLSVVVASAHEPNITRLEPVYDADDVIDANCTSAPSTPTAKIRWLLNGHEADPQFLQRPTESTNDVFTEPPNPTSTWLGIRLRANKKLFGRHDWLELTCEAQVSVLPPLQRVARIRLWQPTAVPDTAPTVDSFGRGNDRLAQRSSPMTSGSSEWRPNMKPSFLICSSIATVLLKTLAV